MRIAWIERAPDFAWNVALGAVADGTIAALLERHRLAGALAPEAIGAWREAPAYFAGPKALMNQLQSNALKALQTAHYAVWFAARGATLAELLGNYLAALVAATAR